MKIREIKIKLKCFFIEKIYNSAPRHTETQ